MLFALYVRFGHSASSFFGDQEQPLTQPYDIDESTQMMIARLEARGATVNEDARGYLRGRVEKGFFTADRQGRAAGIPEVAEALAGALVRVAGSSRVEAGADDESGEVDLSLDDLEIDYDRMTAMFQYGICPLWPFC